MENKFNRSKWLSEFNKKRNKERTLNIDKDILYDLYVNQHKTRKECAEYFNCSTSVIANRINLYNIKLTHNQKGARFLKEPCISKDVLYDLYLFQE